MLKGGHPRATLPLSIVSIPPPHIFVCPAAPTSAPHVGTQGFGDGRAVHLDCRAINQPATCHPAVHCPTAVFSGFCPIISRRAGRFPRLSNPELWHYPLSIDGMARLSGGADFLRLIWQLVLLLHGYSPCASQKPRFRCHRQESNLQHRMLLLCFLRLSYSDICPHGQGGGIGSAARRRRKMKGGSNE